MSTNAEFLGEKLANYKKFIRDSGGNPDKCDELDKYTIDVFLAFGASTLLPLKNSSGGVSMAVDKTIEYFSLPHLQSSVGLSKSRERVNLQALPAGLSDPRGYPHYARG